MNSYIQILDFFIYFIVGIILSLIFDVFRAFRKYRKVNDKVLVIQDLIYFFISAIVIVFVAIYLFKDTIRVYLFVSIFFGISFYLKFFSKFFTNLFIESFKYIHVILEFIVLPILVFFKGINKIYNKFIIFLKITCKKNKNMIFYNYNKMLNIVKKRKK